MKNKPNTELIDDENPEGIEAIFKETKMAEELLPHLINREHDAVKKFKIGLQEAQKGHYEPIEKQWAEES
jgi:hypothetical protein